MRPDDTRQGADSGASPKQERPKAEKERPDGEQESPQDDGDPEPAAPAEDDPQERAAALFLLV